MGKTKEKNMAKKRNHEVTREPAEPAEVPTARGEVAGYAYNNEADEGCVCVLTFEDGSTAQGFSARTENLASDQHNARSAAFKSIGL